MNVNQGSTRQRVRHLMHLDQRFRDDDRLLILKVWESDGFIMTKEQRAIYMSLPSGEIISRRRREFSREFPASMLANERRYRHYKEFSDEFGKQSWVTKLIKRKGI